MAAVGEHPNVINIIGACTETGISNFNFKPGHRCKFIYQVLWAYSHAKFRHGQTCT